MNSHRCKQCGIGRYYKSILAVATVFVLATSTLLANDVGISTSVPDTAAIREMVGEESLIVDVTRERVEFYFDSIGYTAEQLLAGRVDNVPPGVSY
jgi:hypothetical protein